jgi:hypothetical protein
MGAACGGEPEDPTQMRDTILSFIDRKHEQTEAGKATHPLVCIERELGLNFLEVGAFLDCANKNTKGHEGMNIQDTMNEISTKEKLDEVFDFDDSHNMTLTFF